MNKSWDEIKQDVSLAEFAIDQYGYRLNEKKSSISWKLLEKGDEKIIVNKKYGKYLYFNPENDIDKGSIVDFILNRENANTNYRDVYNIISKYISGVQQETRKPNIKIPDSKQEYKFNRKKFWDNMYKIGFNSFVNKEFFNNRGIDTSIFKDKFFNKIFSQSIVKGNKKYVNTLFPLVDATGDTIGFDVRNEGYKGTYGIKKGSFWSSTYDKDKPAHIILTDSPLDSIAHYQLYGQDMEKKGENILYLSSAGTLQINQIDTLNKLINNPKFIFSKISFGFDNKPTDQRFTTRALGHLKLPSNTNENKPLKFAIVNPVFIKNEDNYIDITVNTKSKEDAIKTLSSFHELILVYNKDQAKFSGEEHTFNIKDEILKDKSLKIKIEFNNHLGNWITANEMIRDFKFDKTPNIEFLHPRGKDFNEELMLKSEIKQDKDKSLEI